MNTNMQADFQICISIALISYLFFPATNEIIIEAIKATELSRI